MFFRAFPYAIVVVLSFVIDSCNMVGFNADESMILGYWKTEKEIWGGFKVPLSPNIEIKKNSFILVTKDGKHDMPIENIEVENSSVTINFKETSVSLVFVFENKDRMYFRVPYIRKRIYFVRSKPF